MQHVVIFIFAIAVCGPLLVNTKKVIFVIPRNMKRNYESPFHHEEFHQSPFYGKKRGFGRNHFHTHEDVHVNHDSFHAPSGIHFGKDPPPLGGDDFDQGTPFGTEENHVVIPHGKGISHGISFGKGYIPYDQFKEDFSFGISPDEYKMEGAEFQRYQSDDHFETNSMPRFPAMSAEYTAPESQLTEVQDSFLPEEHDEAEFEVQERSKVNPEPYSLPYHSSDSPTTKEVITPEMKSQVHSSNSLMVNEVSEPFIPRSLFKKDSSQQTASVKIPSVTLGGHRGGIIIQDTIALTDYNNKVKSLTQSWPGSASFATYGAGFNMNLNGDNFMQKSIDLANQFSNAGLPSTNFQTISSRFKGFPQESRGYAVKEDTMEDNRQHDFRTMPVQTVPFKLLPTNFGQQLSSFASPVNG